MFSFHIYKVAKVTKNIMFVNLYMMLSNDFDMIYNLIRN